MTTTANHTPHHQGNLRSIVRLIASYRLLTGCFLLFSYQIELIDSKRFFDLEAYGLCVQIYTVGTLIWLIILLCWSRYLRQQYITHLSFDLILLGLICYYSGGVTNHHDILALLITTFSIAVLPIIQAIGVIATCVVILLGVELALGIYANWTTSFFFIGVEGLTVLGLVPALFMLNTRLQKAQKVAASTHQDYLQLAEVNWDIINCMNTGCIIVDRLQMLVHINPSAAALFNTNADQCRGQNLVSFSEQLAHLYQQQKATGYYRAQAIRLVGIDAYVLPHFFQIARNQQTVILLDNLGQEIANIQHSRLATFGKMIHALMHEIQNPLATMEQALQADDLPDETRSPPASTDKMAILRRQISRMVRIVQSTRNLLPNRQLEQENIVLLNHLRDTIDDCLQDHRVTQKFRPEQVTIDADALRGFRVRFDPTHLAQVLTNLVSNSIDHSNLDLAELKIHITGHRSGRFIELEYWDNGVGIKPEQQASIYQAFQSSEHDHAGLGLHISNELCQLNSARMEYISLSVPARFRLSLPAVG